MLIHVGAFSAILVKDARKSFYGMQLYCGLRDVISVFGLTVMRLTRTARVSKQKKRLQLLQRDCAPAALLFLFLFPKLTRFVFCEVVIRARSSWVTWVSCSGHEEPSGFSYASSTLFAACAEGEAYMALSLVLLCITGCSCSMGAPHVTCNKWRQQQ